jgi:hypothetical protein|eukprot:m.125600 g.125600  ORF g.125600 m.125600 type:complete len:260 (+) comp22141_c0_seq1:118-897(+)
MACGLLVVLVLASAPLATAVTVVVPSTESGVCKHLATLLNRSILRQTRAPDRVIIGIATVRAIADETVQCLDRAKKEARPIVFDWNVVHGKPSPGNSRNAALQLVPPDEAIVFHDIDDVSHPQWIELAMLHLRTAYCVLGSYIYGGDSSRDTSLFRMVGNLSEVAAIPVVHRGSGNVRVDRVSEAPDGCRNAPMLGAAPGAFNCGAVQHGYGVFKTIGKRDRFTSRARGEDSEFIQIMMKAHRRCVYLVFPIICYKCGD